MKSTSLKADSEHFKSSDESDDVAEFTRAFFKYNPIVSEAKNTAYKFYDLSLF